MKGHSSEKDFQAWYAKFYIPVKYVNCAKNVCKATKLQYIFVLKKKNKCEICYSSIENQYFLKTKALLMHILENRKNVRLWDLPLCHQVIDKEEKARKEH